MYSLVSTRVPFRFGWSTRVFVCLSWVRASLNISPHVRRPTDEPIFCFCLLPFRKRPQTPSSLQKVNELATREKSMINKSSLFRLPINTTQTRPNKQTKKTTTTENTQWTFDTKKKLNQSIFFPPRVNSVNKYWKKRRKKNQTSGVKILLLILRKTSFFSSSNKLYVLMLSLLCLLCGLENAVWNRRTYRSIGRSCDRIKVYNVPHFCFFLF